MLSKLLLVWGVGVGGEWNVVVLRIVALNAVNWYVCVCFELVCIYASYRIG